MGRDPSGAARRARDGTTLDVGEVRQGRLVGRLGEARLKVADVLVQGQVILLMMKVMKVKGLVTVKVLLEMKVLVRCLWWRRSFSSLSLQPQPRAQTQEQGLQRVFGLLGLRGPASRLCSRHPAGVVLDPFPETRPLA